MNKCCKCGCEENLVDNEKGTMICLDCKFEEECGEDWDPVPNVE